MKKIKNVLERFIACFYVQKPTGEVIVSEFKTKEEFSKTMRLMDCHGRRARLHSPWAFGNRL